MRTAPEEAPVVHTEVADGVHRVGHAHVSCYLLEDDDGVTLVDAGLPSFWPLVGHTLRAIGRRPADLKALVLTHAHFDHVGIARRLVDRLGIPVWAHSDEHYLARHPYRYAHANPRALYPVRHPRGVPILTAMAFAGAFTVKGVHANHALAPGAVLDLPGHPVVVPTPGHTFGHCALHLPERDVVLTGDALVTLDPYTGRTGPRVVAGAATADVDQALVSLDAIGGTGARTLLPGHGEPWRGGATAAVAHARDAGVA